MCDESTTFVTATIHHTQRSSYESEAFAYLIHDVSPVREVNTFRIVRLDHERGRSRLYLRHVVQAHGPAIHRGRWMTFEHFLEKPIQFGSRDALFVRSSTVANAVHQLLDAAPTMYAHELNGCPTRKRERVTRLLQRLLSAGFVE